MADTTENEPTLDGPTEGALWSSVYVTALEAGLLHSKKAPAGIDTTSVLTDGACKLADAAVESFRARIDAGEELADKW